MITYKILHIPTALYCFSDYPSLELALKSFDIYKFYSVEEQGRYITRSDKTLGARYEPIIKNQFEIIEIKEQ